MDAVFQGLRFVNGVVTPLDDVDNGKGAGKVGLPVYPHLLGM